MMKQKQAAIEVPFVMCSVFTLQQKYKWWAFRRMGFAGLQLGRVKGLQFGKMLGIGKGQGFSMKPDFGRYMLLTAWETDRDARHFRESRSLYSAISKRSQEEFTVKLLPVMSKGCWNGENPFKPVAVMPTAYKGPVVALTRASIRWQKLPAFWRHVPGVSHETTKAEGLLAQTGMGEIPIIQQATLSIWRNETSLKAFAYQMHEHQVAIRKTRSEQWYSEELFARFIPLEATGTWNGENPLAGSLEATTVPLF